MRAPEPPERACESQPTPGVDFAEPIERSTQVVVLHLELLDELVLAIESFGVRTLCELLEECGMAIAEVRLLTVRGELHERVLTDRLKHRKSLAVAADEALVDERPDRIKLRFAHRLGRGQC